MTPQVRYPEVSSCQGKKETGMRKSAKELSERITALEGGLSEAARLYHQGHERDMAKPWTECTKAVACREFQLIMAGEWAFTGRWIFQTKQDHQ